MTKYCLTLKLHATGRRLDMKYDSATERALAIIGFSSYADVVRQWEEI